jgi:hypothetical protein
MHSRCSRVYANEPAFKNTILSKRRFVAKSAVIHCRRSVCESSKTFAVGPAVSSLDQEKDPAHQL